MSPSRHSVVAAGAMAGLLIVAAAVSIRYASVPLPRVLPFLPMFATAVVILEGLTAFLLTTIYRAVGEPFLAILAGAYAFVVVMAGLQILIFPGVFSDTGLFGAGPQSAIWVWTFWHAGFPALVLFALLGLAAREAGRATRWWQAAGRVLLPAAPAAAAVLVLVATLRGGLLPPLIDGLSYESLRKSMAAKVVVGSNVLALLVCLRIKRRSNMLCMWLAVALLASLADSVITLMASQRYSFGWYSARVQSLVSSSTVLGVLIWEISALYRRLAAEHLLLAERAVRDGLTGVFNRAYFEEELPRDIRYAARAGTPISLLMFDADRFKAYNDSLGHQQGDRCLIAITEAVQNVARRPRDYLVRYGGEEFAVVLPETDRDGSLHCAQAVREAVAALRIPRIDGAQAIVSVSVGVATWMPGDPAIDAGGLVARADAALYRAKAAGRDTVCVDDAASAPVRPQRH